jgi:ubiquinone/menaquinone biosynthesis C-methylase UbiE
LSHRKPHRHRFNKAERQKWQNPEAILVDIGLTPGFTFVDVGCNDGFFALPAARVVGEGEIYGLDTDSEATDMLREKAEEEGMGNLILKVGRAEDTVLCPACADIVFFSIALHDFGEPARVLVNATKMLKPTGRLVNLDWKKVESFGPPVAISFSEEYAARLIEDAGFRVESVKDILPHHYIITAGL